MAENETYYSRSIIMRMEHPEINKLEDSAMKWLYNQKNNL